MVGFTPIVYITLILLNQELGGAIEGRLAAITVRRQQALTYLALSPYEPIYQLARMVGMTRQGLKKVKSSVKKVRMLH